MGPKLVGTVPVKLLSARDSVRSEVMPMPLLLRLVRFPCSWLEASDKYKSLDMEVNPAGSVPDKQLLLNSK
jgi:hypothetical protein